MKVSRLFGRDRPVVSFEFFPPKTEAAEAQLWQTITDLQPLGPSFVSVTDGSGGSTRERTARIVTRVGAETDITPVAHLTCVGSSAVTLRGAVEQYLEVGIENIMALRGDPPTGAAEFVPEPGGFRYAVELVRLIHEVGDFCVGVAGYPDKHPESPDWETCARHVVGKVEAGADFVTTQFFFRAADYFRLRDRLARDVDVPVVPGIMPILNVRQIKRTRITTRQTATPYPSSVTTE